MEQKLSGKVSAVEAVKTEKLEAEIPAVTVCCVVTFSEPPSKNKIKYLVSKVQVWK